MNISERFDTIPHNVRILFFCGIFLIALAVTYSFFEEARMLEKRISSKQRDLVQLLQLRDYYEAKRHAVEKSPFRKPEQQRLSLTVIEDMVGRTFIGGHLSQLQPVTAKEGKMDRRAAVDVKVTGAPLGEVIAFVQAAENAGFQIGRIRLSLPAANPTALDIQATVMERRTHG
jgi:hypothetical protein